MSNRGSHPSGLACPSMRGETDSSNWIDGPHNRWGFLHVRELTRTARIGGSPTENGALPPRNSDVSGVTFDHPRPRWRVYGKLGGAVTHRGMGVVDRAVTF